MKCPKDGTELTREDLLGIELDKCDKCDGIWFDHGELERLRDSQITDFEKLLAKKYGDAKFAKGQTEGYMECPRCTGKLQRFSYSYIGSLYVDRCSDCFGIWVDEGELDAIIRQKKMLDEQSADLKALMRSMERTLGEEG